MEYERFENLLSRFIQACNERLDFGIEDMHYYSCLPLCALDAIFSIGVHYSGTSRTIDDFCREFDIPRAAPKPFQVPSRSSQTTVGQVLEKLKDVTPAMLANRISNLQRTSTKGGILKAEAFMLWLDILELYEIQTYQDFHKKGEKGNLEQDLRAVRGQGSGISTNYFYMLAGNTNDVKVDRHIMAFTLSATGEDKLSPSVVKDLFTAAVKEFQSNRPGLTVRHLDHIVWEYQRSRTR